MTPVAGYIAAQPPAARPALRKVRAAIRKALPKASEGISYRIPVRKLDGRMLHSKATIRFALDEAVPARLIMRIARLRAAEVTDPRRKPHARRSAG